MQTLWIKLNDKEMGECYKCGECGKVLPVDFPYCPFCGMSMKRETAKWLKEYDGIKYPYGYVHCSKCDNPPLLYANGRYSLSNYCPNCGADMRGDKNDKRND